MLSSIKNYNKLRLDEELLMLFRSIVVVFFFFLFHSSAYSKNKLQFFTIGTGGVTGVYYSAGKSVCKLVNQRFNLHKMRCAVEVTAASIFNLNAVRSYDLKFGMVQAGIQYEAYKALGPFKNNSPYQSLRSLFSLHDEIFTIITSVDANIGDISDLKGKSVNIGVEGSGTRKGAKELLQFSGFQEIDFKQLTSLKPDQTTSALCAGEIDAYIYMIGHPARNAKESTTRCAAKLVGINDQLATKLDQIPYYVKASIPGGMYLNNEKKINTYSVKATMITDRTTDEEMVYEIVKCVFEKIQEFKKMHPAFADLKVEDMVSKGLTAPLHKGAIKYYKEVGLIQ